MYFEFSNPGLVNSSPINISNHNSINKNVTISYNRPINQFDTVLKSSLVAWQSNRNGKWDLFGKKYFKSTGWHDIIIDTTSGDKNNPAVIYINDSTYIITYEKNFDIYYRQVNTITNFVSNEINITQTPSQKEVNPEITNFKESSSNLCLVFERYKQDSAKSLYFAKTPYSDLNFTNIFFLDSSYDNSNVKFFNSYLSGNFYSVYEKKINGISKVKCKEIRPNSTVGDYVVMRDSINQTKNYNNFHF
ncbi:MAG TPA: hypothetical protein DIS94_03280, partial [Bacteroidetes bacterium]|nr:hypothetical protein [Bacteroidota bacterium]